LHHTSAGARRTGFDSFISTSLEKLGPVCARV
jgi:hypothetical protein